MNTIKRVVTSSELALKFYEHREKHGLKYPIYVHPILSGDNYFIEYEKSKKFNCLSCKDTGWVEFMRAPDDSELIQCPDCLVGTD